MIHCHCLFHMHTCRCGNIASNPFSRDGVHSLLLCWVVCFRVSLSLSLSLSLSFPGKYLADCVFKGAFSFGAPFPAFLTLSSAVATAGILDVDPETRISIEDVCVHPWLRSHQAPGNGCPVDWIETSEQRET